MKNEVPSCLSGYQPSSEAAKTIVLLKHLKSHRRDQFPPHGLQKSSHPRERGITAVCLPYTSLGAGHTIICGRFFTSPVGRIFKVVLLDPTSRYGSTSLVGALPSKHPEGNRSLSHFQVSSKKASLFEDTTYVHYLNE